MIEFEKKILLNKDEYRTLCFFLMQKKRYIQVNYYFDSADFAMERLGITCRVRKRGERYKAILKNHVGGSDCSVENTVGVYDYLNLNAFKDFNLTIQGSMITDRIVVYQDGQCKIVLDFNRYLDGKDYELEVEYTAGCEDIAEYYIDKIAELLIFNKLITDKKTFIARTHKSKSKSGRFFERKRIVSMRA